MASQRNQSIPLPSSVSGLGAGHSGGGSGVAPCEIDWDKWTRHIESRRRRLAANTVDSTPASAPANISAKSHGFGGLFSNRNYLATATYVSFRLEGLEVSETEVTAALAPGAARRQFRSRQSQRIRNHVVALRQIDAQVLTGKPLVPDAFIHWYTSISCGLCPGDLAEAASRRLIELVHRINFPELRLTGAIQEIVRLHRALLTDPLVPSFNGILSRLMLRFHLGRCGLPTVLFPADTPATALTSERMLLPMMMEFVEDSYDLLLAFAVRSRPSAGFNSQ